MSLSQSIVRRRRGAHPSNRPKASNLAMLWVSQRRIGGMEMLARRDVSVTGTVALLSGSIKVD
jgi:hypothetical protein